MTKCIVLGESSPEKKELKPIEVIKYLNSDLIFEDEDVDCTPIFDKWENIELISKDYINDVDVMFAYKSNDRSAGVLYLGKWNDGVV